MTLSGELWIALWRHRLVDTGSLVGGMALFYARVPIGALSVTFGGCVLGGRRVSVQALPFFFDERSTSLWGCKRLREVWLHVDGWSCLGPDQRLILDTNWQVRS